MIRAFRILVVVAIVAVVASFFFPKKEKPQQTAMVELPPASAVPDNQSTSPNAKPALPESPSGSSAKRSDDGLNFTTQSLSGGKIHLSQFGPCFWRRCRSPAPAPSHWDRAKRGGCAPCRRQIPELNQLYKKYNKTRGLVVLGISCDMIDGKGLQSVEPFVEELQIDYPIALADQALVDSLGVEAIPTTLFVGPDGKVVSRIVGAGRSGEISENTMLLMDGGKNSHVADL